MQEKMDVLVSKIITLIYIYNFFIKIENNIILIIYILILLLTC
jgi:hypothetical protein